ncbi:MAG: hypothetical protein HY660_18495 [Armatimonadetes bacterium]|nr:hypothetical protein [Armatimonadota bacterium]
MRRVGVLLGCAILLALAVPRPPAEGAAAIPAGRLAYHVMVDLVRGSVEPTSTVCVQTSVFKQGEQVVWRVVVRDAVNGREIGDDGKNAAEIAEREMKVTAHLENGMTFPLKYGPHPGRPQPGDPVKHFWTASWVIPRDYPTGLLRWWVTVADKRGVFVRFDPIGAGIKVPAHSVTIERR